MTHCARVLALLADGEPHSHHEGYALNVILHSRVSELRKRGHRIEMWRDGDLYLYRLLDAGLTEGDHDAEHSAQAGQTARVAPSVNPGRCCVEPDPWLPPRAHRDAGDSPSPQARGGRALQSSELTGRESCCRGAGSFPPSSAPESAGLPALRDNAGRRSRPVSSSPIEQLTLTEVAA